VPSVFARVPGIPNSPDRYARVHPDRVKKFPSSNEELSFNPKEIAGKKIPGMWRHELEHDAESVFWLLLYWAMVVQPENIPKEKIDVGSWADLNGDHTSRHRLIVSIPLVMSANLLHPFYDPLRPLIKDLAAILVIDGHWLPASDLRKDPYYITEAFQRLILDFIIKNREEEFMKRRVDKTFRDPHSIQKCGASSSSHIQSLDAAERTGGKLVGCGCGSASGNLHKIVLGLYKQKKAKSTKSAKVTYF
jgi:hypothetical protein